ncbi:MAG: signal peptidase II [Phycisphaerae bacterium]
MDASTASGTSRDDGYVEAAVRHLPSQVCFWVVAGAVLWLDLWSKDWAFRALASDKIHPIIPGIIDFRRSLNAGAVFGSFSGYTSVFIVASLFALGFVFYLFAHSRRAQRGLHVALALILAGALGNLYDRAFIIADVVSHNSPSGRREPRIGKILSEPGAPVIRIGDWPDGANEQRFSSGTVTVRQQGVVRDFIKFVPKFPARVPKLAGQDTWPWVFNVADAALVCGVAVLLLHTLFDRRPRRRHE